MKLPEYKDDAPLYSDNSKSSEGEDIKFTVMGFGLPVVTVVCIGFVLYGLFNFLKGALY